MNNLKHILSHQDKSDKRYNDEDSEIFMPSENTTFDNKISGVNIQNTSNKSIGIDDK